MEVSLTDKMAREGARRRWRLIRVIFKAVWGFRGRPTAEQLLGRAKRHWRLADDMGHPLPTLQRGSLAIGGAFGRYEATLLRAVCAIHPLVTLRVSGLLFDESMHLLLREGLSACATLEVLHVPDLGLGPREAPLLLEALAPPPADDRGPGRTFVAAAASSPLSFGGAGSSPRRGCPRLKALDLRANVLTAESLGEGGRWLRTFLERARALESLDLSANLLGDQGLAAVSAALAPPGPGDLPGGLVVGLGLGLGGGGGGGGSDLRGGDDDGTVAASLRELSLRSNGFSSKALAASLLAALKDCACAPSLARLDVAANPLHAKETDFAAREVL